MIAQIVPVLTFDEIARFGVCAIVIAWGIQVVVNIYRTIFPYQPKQADQYVTHAQMDLFKTDVNNKFDKLQMYMEGKLGGFDGKFEKMDAQAREASHRINNSMQTLVSGLAELRGVILGKVTATSKPQEE